MDVAAQLRAGPDEFYVSTRRGKQFNSMVQKPVDPLTGAAREDVLIAAEDSLLKNGHVQRGDLIVLTIGEPMGKSGGTNTMKIVRVGEEHRS